MEIKIIGNVCAQHGPYTFYKGLKIVPHDNNTTPVTHERKSRKCVSENKLLGFENPFVLTIGDSVPVKPWSDSHISCLAELRMIWREKSDEAILTSLRLYFHPENTPSGRVSHGEDELIAITDEIVIYAEDLLKWIDVKMEWNWGSVKKDVKLETNKTSIANNELMSSLKEFLESDLAITLKQANMDLKDVENEKKIENNMSTNIFVLSYPRYCRFRAILRRLESIPDQNIKNMLISILSGLPVSKSDIRVMFCRDTFDYPELESHEHLCNHLAPKLKSRPRTNSSLRNSFSIKKEESTDSDDSSSFIYNKYKEVPSKRPQHLRLSTRIRRESLYSPIGESKNLNNEIQNINIKSEPSDDDENDNDFEINSIKNKYSIIRSGSSTKSSKEIPNPSTPSEEKFFLRKLHEFHIRQHIQVPKLTWTQLKGLHLYEIFRQVKKLGGYEFVTKKKLWKQLFGKNTKAVQNITRSKYEQILLPLEKSQLVKKKSDDTDEISTFNDLSTVPSTSDANILNRHKTQISKPKGTNSSNSNMTEIQTKFKFNSLQQNEGDLNDDVEIVTTVNTSGCGSDNKYPSITVLLGQSESRDAEKRKDFKSNQCNDLPSSSHQNFGIKQPHTTITVHQTTMRPQSHCKNLANQVTNQIKIQQIIMNPESNEGTSTDSDDNQESSSIIINNNNNNNNNNKRRKGKQFRKTENRSCYLDQSQQENLIHDTSINLINESDNKFSSIRSFRLPSKQSLEQATTQNEAFANNLLKQTSQSREELILKKRKLDMLRKGGLEVTAISKKHGVLATLPPLVPAPSNSSKRKLKTNRAYKEEKIFNLPSSTTITIPHEDSFKIAAQSMYSQTGHIFGNPKEDFPSASCSRSNISNGCNNIPSFNSGEILDLTIKPRSKMMPPPSYPNTNLKSEEFNPIEALRRAYMEATNDRTRSIDSGLQITLVPSEKKQKRVTLKRLNQSQTKESYSNNNSLSNLTRLHDLHIEPPLIKRNFQPLYPPVSDPNKSSNNYISSPPSNTNNNALTVNSISPINNTLGLLSSNGQTGFPFMLPSFSNLPFPANILIPQFLQQNQGNNGDPDIAKIFPVSRS